MKTLPYKIKKEMNKKTYIKRKVSFFMQDDGNVTKKKKGENNEMRIVVGGDHAGYELKMKVLECLEKQGHQVLHVGSYTPDMVDFPDIAKKVCEAILKGEAERGIMVCGTGVGAAIACNKCPGIRASVVHDVYTAHQCVEHDNVQVMAIGGQIVGDVVAKELIGIFLKAEFSVSEEFRKRVAKLEAMDAAR